MGEIDAQGALTLTGRKGRAISVADQMVFPEAIEALVTSKAARSCAVLSQPDPDRGQQIVLVLEGARDDALAKQMRQSCRDKLGTHAVPRRVLFHPALPQRASGKVDLAALATWLEDQP